MKNKLIRTQVNTNFNTLLALIRPVFPKTSESGETTKPMDNDDIVPSLTDFPPLINKTVA